MHPHGTAAVLPSKSDCCIWHVSGWKPYEDVYNSWETCAFWYYCRASGDERCVYVSEQEFNWFHDLIWHGITYNRGNCILVLSWLDMNFNWRFSRLTSTSTCPSELEGENRSKIASCVIWDVFRITEISWGEVRAGNCSTKTYLNFHLNSYLWQCWCFSYMDKDAMILIYQLF